MATHPTLKSWHSCEAKDDESLGYEVEEGEGFNDELTHDKGGVIAAVAGVMEVGKIGWCRWCWEG